MGKAALLIVSVLALAGGVGAWALTSDEPSAPSTRDEGEAEGRRARRRHRPTGDAVRTQDASQSDRIARLESEVAALRRDVKSLKMHMRAGPAVAWDDEETSADQDSPTFEGAVRDIIEADRTEAVERRTEAMRDRFTERRSEALDALVADAGLNDTQRDAIDTLWETESDQLIPLFVAAREGERPFSEVREEAEKLREDTDTSVAQMLTSEQFEMYKETRPGPPRGRRGSRGGPPPPP